MPVRLLGIRRTIYDSDESTAVGNSAHSPKATGTIEPQLTGVYSRRKEAEDQMPGSQPTMAANDAVDSVPRRSSRNVDRPGNGMFATDKQGLDNHGHSISVLRLSANDSTVPQQTNVFLATPPATPERILDATETTLPAQPPSTTASTVALTAAAAQANDSDRRSPIMTQSLELGPQIGRLTSITIDIVLILILGAWIGVIELGLIPHTKRGFYCNDTSISYPFRGETITTSMILGSILVPFVLMWLSEAIFYQPASIKSTRLRKSLGSAAFWFREYFIGMVLHLFLMDTVKILVGELRPHFLHTCKPDAALNCSTGEFISDYECTSTEFKAYLVRDSSKSFPSGHSSISFFEAIFMVWFIHRRVPQLRSRLLVPTVQTLLLFWACFCSFSRIVDHRHHWWDVLLGAILGTVFAILTCLYLCKDFKRKPAFAPDSNVQNGSPDRHTSVRRLLAEPSCCKDDVTMSHVIVT